MDVFSPGDHGSTFGGNPVAAAVGKAAIDVLLEEYLVDRARSLGKYFMDEWRKINCAYIKEIRGKGLLIGLEVKEEYGFAHPFCEKLMEMGLLCKETHEQTIRFAPSLRIKKEDLDWALDKIRKVFTESMEVCTSGGC